MVGDPIWQVQDESIVRRCVGEEYQTGPEDWPDAAEVNELIDEVVVVGRVERELIFQ